MQYELLKQLHPLITKDTKDRIFHLIFQPLNQLVFIDRGATQQTYIGRLKDLLYDPKGS